MKNIIFLFLVLSFLSGCATPYQEKGFWGDGYSDTQIDKNVFRVSFNGNSDSSSERVYDFVLLRSAEISLNHGYKYFSIIESSNISSSGVFTTPITSNSYGTTTTITGGQTFSYTNPGYNNLIYCYKQKPNDGYAFNAEYIQKSISDKYNITLNS